MPDSTVPADVRALATQMAEPTPMRRGSVSERYVKCNKPAARCSSDPRRATARTTACHAWSKGQDAVPLARRAEQAKQVREQVEAGQQFRRHVEAYWQACEQWADAELEAPEAASQEAAKKGASKRRSKPRSSPRSKRS